MTLLEPVVRSFHAVAVAIALAISGPAASGQAPSRVDYTLRVDSVDPSGVAVEMRIHGAPAEFRLAMAAHPELDDRYWRFLAGFRGESARGAVSVMREDSSLWRVAAPAGDVTIRYRVRFPASPPMQQASWKAHLTPTGGLVGGPHSFLYVVGAEHTPVRVTVELPSAWTVATGLARAGALRTFSAPGTEALVDSPILVGLIRHWRFDVDGVPHDIAYLGNPAGVTFDTALFVGNVERIVREAARLFGRMPYQRYQFLFEDGTYGGLEHLNSVSIGTRSANLARDPTILLGQIAHEFFHTWNEVHVRPASWIGVRHVAPAPTGELWWSEGVTLYFADLVLRRAGLPRPDSTRVQHLEGLIGLYLANPSHAMVSPEQTSRAFNSPGAAGDYTPSMYTQGELVGAMLDLMIRDASRGRRSLDDAMRALATRFTPKRGFTGIDVERAVGEACGCDARPFFDDYVRHARALEFDRWLAVVGLGTVVTWAPARTTDGAAAADSRLSGYVVPGEAALRLRVWFPTTVWGRAGLHTGDQLVSWNGVVITDAQPLRAVLEQLHIGDTVRVSVVRDSGRFETNVTVEGYERPTVRVQKRSDATDAQRRLRIRWLAGQ
jgi:predicted metalloprotease with PDZ domain